MTIGPVATLWLRVLSLHIQSKIQRSYAVRQRTNRDQVNAGRSNLADPFERDPATGFHERSPCDLLHTRT
jgi:hypothetical protein